VSRLCLGTMTFGVQSDEATGFAVMDKAAEGGVDFIDTSDAYPLGGDLSTRGRTEEIIGRWRGHPPGRGQRRGRQGGSLSEGGKRFEIAIRRRKPGAKACSG
jgi:Aldo/keto reductase family